MTSPPSPKTTWGSSRTPGSKGWEGLRVRLPRDQLTLVGGLLSLTQTRRRDWPSWTERDGLLPRVSGPGKTERKLASLCPSLPLLSGSYCPGSEHCRFPLCRKIPSWPVSNASFEATEPRSGKRWTQLHNWLLPTSESQPLRREKAGFGRKIEPRQWGQLRPFGKEEARRHP